jgi:hypothetical protein
MCIPVPDCLGQLPISSKDIEGIMMNRFARNLSLGKKLMLATAAVAAVSGPFAFGIVSAKAQTPSKEAFEVATLRLEDPHSTVDYNRPDAPNSPTRFQPIGSPGFTQCSEI